MLPQVAAVLSEPGGKLSVRARKGASGCSRTDPTTAVVLKQPAVADVSPCPCTSLQGFPQKPTITRKRGRPKFLAAEAGGGLCIQGE